MYRKEDFNGLQINTDFVIARYVFSIGPFLIALLLRYYLFPQNAGLQFVTFFPLEMIIPFIFGMGPALLNILLSVLAANYFFVAPFFSFKFTSDVNFFLAECIFILSGIISLFIASRLRANENKLKKHMDWITEVDESLKISAAIFESQEGMMVTDENLTILKINKAFSEITGFNSEDLVGLSPKILKSGKHDNAFYAKMWQEITLHNYWKGEIYDRKKDGTIYPKFLSITAVKNSKGKITNFVSTHIDLTTQKQFEHDILSARESAEKANRAKSEFLANISHEIRTPLNGILGTINLFRKLELTEIQKHYLENMKISGDQLMVLINGILDLSKIESGHLDLELVEFDINELFSELCSLYLPLARDKGLNFSTQMNVSSQFLVGDSFRIRQILINFLSNALKFTKSGTITFKVSCNPINQIADNDYGQLVFSVSDTGVGIPADFQEKIFTPFLQADNSTSRNFGGTGLGLVICKELANLMCGKIEFTSQDGIGSTFSFLVKLPISKVHKVKKETDVFLNKTIDRKSVHILLAEDNIINQEITKTILLNAGYLVDAVEDGLQVLEAVEKKNYSIILMDCQMPVLDGYEAAKEIRKRKNQIPIIALTSHAFNSDRIICLGMGMNEYFSKPFDEVALITCIDQLTSKELTLSQLPIIDHGRISKLRSIDQMSSSGLVDKIIKMYLERTPEMLNQLSLALNKQDVGLLKKIAHKYKSSSSNLGLLRISSILENIENLNLITEEYYKNFELLKIEIDLAIIELESYLQTREPNSL